LESHTAALFSSSVVCEVLSHLNECAIKERFMKQSALFVSLMLGVCRAADSQSTFEFHSNFWVNLHHFLYEQASAKEPAPSDSEPWQSAVAYYRAEIVKQDLLSDKLFPINDALSKLESAKSLTDSHLPPALAAVLEKAAPVYRARRWPEHNRVNLAWIEAAMPLVAQYEAGMKKELSAAYATPWQSAPIRTDVAEYAGWAGAYTTVDPTHITISSTNTGNLGKASLETLFHEASHGMISKVSAALDAELNSRKQVFQKRGMWHTVLFYTVGEVTRRHLDDYTPYAISHGLYDGSWKGALPVLEKDWKPYLDGKIDLATAVRRLVDDFGIPRGPIPKAVEY
jgi:hypothetical protein